MLFNYFIFLIIAPYRYYYSIFASNKNYRIVLRLENSTFKKINEKCQVFNGGLRLRVSFMDGRLQRKATPQILFIGVFSTNDNAVFLYPYF